MIYPDVQDLTNQDLKVLCDAYRKNNFIDPEISEKLGVKRGLRNADGTGVLAGLTNICDVIGYQRDENNNIILIDGKLIYRGIDLNDIVTKQSHKIVSYLRKLHGCYYLDLFQTRKRLITSVAF